MNEENKCFVCGKRADRSVYVGNVCRYRNMCNKCLRKAGY